MILHLSKITLNPQSRQVQNELMSSVEMHRTLCHAFPNLSEQQWREARVLFRVDDDNEQLCALVQSHVAPDWGAFAAHLKSRYLLGAPRVKSWEPRFEEGQTLRFRLQANPTFSPLIEGATRKNGRFKSRRTGLFREAERLDWLRRQGQQHGFELPLVETTLRASFGPDGRRRPIPFRGGVEADELRLELPTCEVRDLNDGRRFPLKGDAAGQFSAARFDGVLRVTEPNAFALAVQNGVGHARGFGFGLLSLAPAKA